MYLCSHVQQSQSCGRASPQFVHRILQASLRTPNTRSFCLHHDILAPEWIRKRPLTLWRQLMNQTLQRFPKTSFSQSLTEGSIATSVRASNNLVDCFYIFCSVFHEAFSRAGTQCALALPCAPPLLVSCCPTVEFLHCTNRQTRTACGRSAQLARGESHLVAPGRPFSCDDARTCTRASVPV